MPKASAAAISGAPVPPAKTEIPFRAALPETAAETAPPALRASSTEGSAPSETSSSASAARPAGAGKRIRSPGLPFHSAAATARLSPPPMAASAAAAAGVRASGPSARTTTVPPAAASAPCSSVSNSISIGALINGPPRRFLR